MTTSSTVDQTISSPTTVNAVAVRRDAFYLDDQGQPLFAWLHQSAEGSAARHGVVICSPVGFEQLHAHRGLRHLADELARRQIPALRFDWHGTGDSAGDDLDADRLATWCSNVRAAVTWMKQTLQVSHVSVVGLRIGATVAALGLGDEEIDNLVLWAPVVNGRGFVREMTVVDMMSEFRDVPSQPAGTIEAAGFRLSPQSVADLSACSLLQAKPRCHRILIAGRDDAPTDSRLVRHLESLTVELDQRSYSGLAEMLVEPHKSQLAETAIRGIADWLEAHADSLDSNHHLCFADLLSTGSVVESAVVNGPDGNSIRELTCRIHSSPDLFGIVSEPVSAVQANLPMLVLLNAGSSYHIGPGRMTVEMTRKLSSLGFRCLRTDFWGLGDSVPERISDENDGYASTVFRDIKLTLQTLRRQFGPQKFVLMGLCSGAYAAFQSAAQFDDPDLVESVLINPLTFFWRDGMTLETAPTLDLIEQHYYLSSVLDPKKWLRLLTGRSSVGLRGVAKMAWRRLGFGRRRNPQQHLRPCECPRGPLHPVVDDLTGDLKRVVTRGRHLMMVFSAEDPGYGILTYKAGRQARRMLRAKQLETAFIENADHTFSRQAARSLMIATLGEHLCGRYRAKPI